jgi:hypothetical protein
MKHVIKSDNFANFNTLWRSLGEKLGDLGEVIVKCKIRMTTYNNDYRGYTPSYVAKVWTKRNEGGAE